MMETAAHHLACGERDGGNVDDDSMNREVEAQVS